MTQRWRKPVKALSVSDTHEWASAELGRAALDYQARFSQSDIERFRLGYACIRCWEPQESAFPYNCALCGYQMKADQPAEFHQKFQGIQRDPRATLIRSELDKLDDKHERNFYENKNGIVIPRGI